jgi:uncharacterized iron-regulated protein
MKRLFLLIIVNLGYQIQAQINLLDTTLMIISQNELALKMASYDVLFFGESHDDSLDHRMELRLLHYLDSLKRGKLKLGMEMFETDQQLVLDEYLNDLLSDKYFTSQCLFWSNYKSDYHPLVRYARDSSLQVIGTNAPNRYAKMVYYYGDEYLHLASKQAKIYFVMPSKFDSTLTTYAEIKQFVPPRHNATNLLKSQVLKDATMANSIIQNRSKKELFFHINGSYHTKNGEGIIWHLKVKKSKLKIAVITHVDGQYVLTEY